MSRLRRSSIAILTAVGCVAAGCEYNAPLESERAPTSTDARFDGGVMHGSGNRGSDSTTTPNSTTQESGVMHGSGN